MNIQDTNGLATFSVVLTMNSANNREHGKTFECQLRLKSPLKLQCCELFKAVISVFRFS